MKSPYRHPNGDRTGPRPPKDKSRFAPRPKKERPRPPEVVVAPDGQTWHVARRRETWEDLVRLE
jgi:hypothetical protein